MNNEVEIIKQLFGSLSDSDKKLFLKSLKIKDGVVVTKKNNKEVSCCPINNIRYCKISHKNYYKI